MDLSLYQEESNFNFRGLKGFHFSFLFKFQDNIRCKQTVDPDKTPCSVMSILCLRYLHMVHKNDGRLI